MVQPSHVVLAVSGASGACYAVRCLELLIQAEVRVDLIVSPAARRVLREETGILLEQDPQVLLGKMVPAAGQLKLWDHADIGAPPASGTAIAEVVMVTPCSLSTLAAIASGQASNLIERAAQVALKEGRRLILVPRETPLSRLHLDAMSRLAWAGATILPASPGFYRRPRTVEELVDQLCGKILDSAGVDQDCLPPWEGCES